MTKTWTKGFLLLLFLLMTSTLAAVALASPARQPSPPDAPSLLPAWWDDRLLSSIHTAPAIEPERLGAASPSAIDTRSPLDTVYLEDFEFNDGGYPHGGTLDEWEWGTPTAWPGGCASGDKCWGTDLDNDYENGCNQVLTSTVIDLSAVVPGTDLTLTWWQAWHAEHYLYDPASVEVRIDGGSWTEIWTNTGAAIQQQDWIQMGADVSGAAGGTLRVRWRLESNETINYAGLFVDRVQIRTPEPDLSGSTHRVSAGKATPGQRLTYTVAVRNTGTLAATSVVVSDTIPNGAIYTPGDAVATAGTLTDATTAVRWQGDVPPGDAVTLTIPILVDVVNCGSTISNTAVIAHPSLGMPLELRADVQAWDRILYAEDFESDAGAFTASGTNTSWAWGIVGTYEGTRSIYPTGAHSGRRVWATDLAGDYTANEDSYLTSPRIDLAAAAPDGAVLWLQWWDWFSTEPGYDEGVVEARGGGTGWVTVTAPMEGVQGGWTERWVDISSFPGASDFQVRFHLIADELVNYPGWYVDDVVIHQCAPPPGLYLTPSDLAVTGCNGISQTHSLHLYNETGAGGTFDLAYAVEGRGTVEGPPTLTVGSQLGVNFPITLTPDLCLPDGAQVVAQVTVTGNAYTATAQITQEIETTAECPACDEEGWLAGHVTDEGGAGVPCGAATVHVEPSGIDVPVDSSGYYTVALHPFDYQVTASAAGYPEVDGPHPVTVALDAATTRDFVLSRPEAVLDPHELTTIALAPGVATRTITITNSGGYPLSYEIEEQISPLITTSTASAVRRAGGADAYRPDEARVIIDPALQAQLETDGAAGYMIVFRSRPDLAPARDMDWIERGRFVASTLQRAAGRAQTGVRAYLQARSVDYHAFWIDNVILVPRSSRLTVNGLLSFPEIAALRPVPRPVLHEPVAVGRPAAPRTPTGVEPNLTHIGVDQVWSKGITGQGIVVANIDTGVRYTHDALVDRYRGTLEGGSYDHAYNWWDPDVDGSQDPAPNDFSGHGSHTAGTMVGDDGAENRIGVAPDARWIACQAFEGGSDAQVVAELLECAQFLVAPWDQNGEQPNADLRPHVVNNSWGDQGCNGYDDWYQDVVDAWHAAGIYPVVSNGNQNTYCSPSCGSVGNPGRYGNVTGVGATGQADGALASYSLWGPTDHADTVNPRGYPYLKPQVVAPGTNRSAGQLSDEDYYYNTGTSMAAPHVSGLVALMWSAAPCLVGDYATTETIIEQTATPIPYASGCGGEGPANVPNYATGWGEIDACAAVEAAQDHCRTDWLPWVAEDPVTGTVASGAQTVALTFTCDITAARQPQPLQGTLQVVHDDPCQEPLAVDLTFYCIDEAPVPTWAKSVSVDGALADPPAGPHAVRPEDQVVVIDRVGAVYSETVTAVLTETWDDALALVDFDARVGTVTTGTGVLVWDLAGVTPTVDHVLTKTYRVAYGSWVTAHLTESYAVTGALQQLPDVTVAFERYRPALTLEKSGRAWGFDGHTLPIELTIFSDGTFDGQAVLTDALPSGMTYAGNLTATFGRAWVAGDVIHWTSYTTTTRRILLDASTDVVADGGFEEGTPNAYWDEASINFGTPLCDAACVLGGDTWARTGDWWAWFGGAEAYEEGALDQDVTLPDGAATLGFWLEIPADEVEARLDVTLDGDVVFSATQAHAGSYPDYTWVERDVSAYADGGVHTLRFAAYENGLAHGTVTSFFVDDVTLEVLPGGRMPERVTIAFDVRVAGEPGDLIRNLATLDWGADYTNDVHYVDVLVNRPVYLPLVMRNGS
jgi:uncharacterized repeat protein (TIGR01451 family)